MIIVGAVTAVVALTVFIVVFIVCKSKKTNTAVVVPSNVDQPVPHLRVTLKFCRMDESGGESLAPGFRGECLKLAYILPLFHPAGITI